MTTPIARPLNQKPEMTTTQRVGSFIRHNGLQIGIIGVALILWVFLWFAGSRTFQHKDIYVVLAATVPFYGIMALPITLLVIAQEIDLSFGSIMAVGVMTFVAVFDKTGSPVLALLGCLLAGTGVGLINGLIVVRLGIPSLIATIGTQFFWRGFVQILSPATSVPMGPAQEAAPWLNFLLSGQIGDIPMQFIWMVVIAIAIWVLLNRHRVGAHIYLIGDNANSARLMGINVNQRRILMFCLVGLCAAFAGIITSYYQLSFFTSLGDGYLLQTLAAVFLGGTSVLGGTGTILGTFVGSFIIGAIEPGTVAVGLTGSWTQLLWGFVIVLSVAMHSVLRRRIS